MNVKDYLQKRIADLDPDEEHGIIFVGDGEMVVKQYLKVLRNEIKRVERLEKRCCGGECNKQD